MNNSVMQKMLVDYSKIMLTCISIVFGKTIETIIILMSRVGSFHFHCTFLTVIHIFLKLQPRGTASL